MNWKRILITGASSGLGWALACALARPGVTLLLSGRNGDRLSQLSTLVQKQGASAEICVADLATLEGQHHLITIVDQAPPDLVIHSAGIGAYGLFVDTPLEKSLEIIQVNVSAVMAITHAWCRSRISASLPGKVVFVSSVAAFLPIPGMAMYAASKACLTNAAEGLRFEVKRHGISVLTVCPGHFATNFQRRAAGKALADPSSTAAAAVAKDIVRVLSREGVYIPLFWRAVLKLQWLIPRAWLMRYLERRVLANLG